MISRNFLNQKDCKWPSDRFCSISTFSIWETEWILAARNLFSLDLGGYVLLGCFLDCKDRRACENCTWCYNSAFCNKDWVWWESKTTGDKSKSWSMFRNLFVLGRLLNGPWYLYNHLFYLHLCCPHWVCHHKFHHNFCSKNEEKGGGNQG